MKFYWCCQLNSAIGYLRYRSRVILAIRNGNWIEFRGLVPGTSEMHGRRVFAAKNFIEQFFARGRDPSRGRNRQGNVCRMWQDMASGAALFAELVWRVLPRNRSQLTRWMPKSGVFPRGECMCVLLLHVKCRRVNNPLACPWYPKSHVTARVSVVRTHHGATGFKIMTERWLSYLMIIMCMNISLINKSLQRVDIIQI